MAIKKYLTLSLENAEGTTKSFRVPKVKDELTPEEVKTAGKAILNSNIFLTYGEELTKFKSAKVVNTEVTEINIAE